MTTKTTRVKRPKPKPVIPAKFDKKPEQAPAPKLEIVKVQPQEELTLRQSYTDEEIQLMKNTVAKGTTDTEFAFFLYVAKHRGLDPLLKQLHVVKRRSKMRDEDGNLMKVNGEQQYEESMTIQTGIDGYRVIADRTGNYAPSDRRPLYENQGTADFCCTVWIKKWSHGSWHEVSGTAYYSEYVQTYVKWVNGKPEYKPNHMWQKMPRNQLAKCAEALAHRKAFPESTSQLYVNEELEHLDSYEAEKPQRETGSVPAPKSLDKKPESSQIHESLNHVKQETKVEEPAKVVEEPPPPPPPRIQSTIKPSAEPNRGHGQEGISEEQRGPNRPQLKAMMEALLLDLWPNLTIHRKYRAIVGKELFEAEVKADIDRLPMDRLGLGVLALSIFQSRIRKGGLPMPITEDGLINELHNSMLEAKAAMQNQKEARP